MQKRVLGNTGLNVTALGFGGMELRLLDERSANRLLNTLLDLGVNFVDTSPEYPMSEYYIGKCIAHRRSEFVLATKCGDNMSGIGGLYKFDRDTIIGNAEESLRLMKTDYIDVMQLHGVIPEYLPGGEMGEAMEAMRELKRSGKVRHLGVTVCNKGPDHYGFPATYGYNSILRFAAWPEIDVVQLVYGCMTRLSENVIQKAYDDYNTGVVARGILNSYNKLYPERFEVSRIKELFEEGESKHDFFIRYALSHPALSSSVVGTKHIGHLEDNVKAAMKGPLPAEVYAEAKMRLNFAGAIAGPAEMKLDW